LKLFKKIYDNGAVFTILDHNDMTWWKLKNFDPDFIRDFITGLPEDVWIDTLAHVGAFWDRRSRILYRYRIDPTAHQLILTTVSPVPVSGISFVPHGFDPAPDALPPRVRLQHGKLILDLPTGTHTWRIPLR